MREDWVEVELGEVCNFIGGGTPSKANSVFWNGDLPWASIKDMKGDYLNGTQDYITELGLKNSSANLALPGEIILATRITPGKPIFSRIKTAINQDLKVVKPKIKIDTKFLFYSFKSFEKNIMKVSSGTTVLGINLNSLNTFIFPIAPLPIQRAIVLKIENLFASLDKGIADLEKAQQQLKVYRQAVLKKAFEGGFTNKKIKDGELPEGWKILSIGDIVNKNTQKALPSEMPNAKFIGMDCIEAHTLKPFKFYDFREFKSAGNVFKVNQVLYGRMRPYLNKVYKAEIDGTCSGEFIVLDCKNDFNPDLLKYILHHRDFVSFANHKTSGDRPRISFEEIADYPVNVCKPDEQAKIVREIESRLSVCDKVEQSIAESLEKSKALRQSILKKAFEGRLLSEAEVTQCKQAADYGPASELLKKIKAEKVKTHGRASQQRKPNP
jgi:type I restriction enzyme S subunit